MKNDFAIEISSLGDIRFFGPNESNFPLSNFFPHDIEIGGAFYPSNEHYYQSKKFRCHAIMEKIRLAESPKKAKEISYLYQDKWIEKFSLIKVDVMRTAICEKFKNGSLANYLISTFPHRLVEDAADDYFWGIGSNGNGENMLGKLLENHRKILLLNNKAI